MNTGLRKTLENVQYNMIHKYYPKKIIKQYFPGNNIIFSNGDEDSFLYINIRYYCYYIYLCIFNIS